LRVAICGAAKGDRPKISHFWVFLSRYKMDCKVDARFARRFTDVD